MKNLTYKISLLVLGLFAAAVTASAQKVSGVVTDIDGLPLIGVSVILDGTTNGVSTDIDGVYSIDVPDAKGKTLVFSCIGLATKYVVIGQDMKINVVLEEDANFLNETVVIGYATVKRRDLMGSVTSIGADALVEQPVTTVSQALSGKMAGVSVTTSEGDPDADVQIRVRGGGSITQDNSPLYIVDGFPVDNINDISSSEIQSIDVLKDAFSTAIYGSRGANGVVIVTTKSGEKGRKATVSFNAYYGLKKMANASAIQAMDVEEFVKFQYELAAVRKKVSDSYEPYFGSFQDIDQYKGMSGNNWVDNIFGNTGNTFNADLSISGSGENYQWTMGYAHITDNAIMTGSNYSRDNLNLKTKFKLAKNLSIDANVRYSSTRVRGGGANGINDAGTTSGNGRLKHAVCYTPIPLSSTIEGLDLEEDYGDNAPPLSSIADNDQQKKRKDLNMNASLSWEIIDNLNLKIEGGYQDYRETSDRFYGLTTYYVANNATYKNTPANRYTDNTKKRYRNTNTLSYNFSSIFDPSVHSLDILVGEEMTILQTNTFVNMVENFPLSFSAEKAWNFMSSGTSVTSSNYYNADDRLLSFFGRINYELLERYSFSATLRADGSSKFAAANRWGIFPSAAVAWKLSNEPWMSWSKSWLDQFKIRYSFGTAGNNNIPTGQISRVFSGGSPTWNGSMTTYSAGTVMSNPDLKWETTITHNVGVDFSLWDGRLSGSIEAYQNNTRDLLIQFPISGAGYASQYRNMGETRNRGAELTLNVPIIRKTNVDLTFTGNISCNQNRVMSLGGLEKIEVETRWSSNEGGTDFIVMPNRSLGNVYGYKVDGRYEVSDFDMVDGKWVLRDGVVDCTAQIGSDYMRPGALKLKDLDGDGKPDKTIIANTVPNWQGGFGISGYLWGVDFCANFTYALDYQVYNANKIEFTSSRKYSNRNLLKEMSTDNRWTNIDWETGELITDPDVLQQVNAGTTMWSPCIGNAVITDWAMEDGSFLRLQSATIGYTFPEKWMSKAHIRKLRVYVTGTNLFCLTNYSGYDPEVNTRRDTPLSPGVDYSAYPKSRGFVCGINLTF
ncbi:MAG: SusC/RagA family TonB-linked outer membrane protein [Candidatus Cryptobacteroides sp.]